MARPIWTGTLAFGLLNIPVSLMSGERRTDLSFRMLDSRDQSPIRYERVNADTGEEVPWKDIVKAFEYDKGSYVVIDKETLEEAAPEGHGEIQVEAFVPRDQLGAEFFEKPYVLVPAKKAEKGYVLLREALERTGRIGIARVVIRTREHLAAILPDGDALRLVMIRYAQEVIALEDFALPRGGLAEHRVNDKEIEFSAQLIEAMSGDWEPDLYRDEFRERLHEVIEARIAAGGGRSRSRPEAPDVGPDAATNVVDFMALLKKSLAEQGGKPAASKSASKSGKASKTTKSKTASPAKKPAPAATKRATKKRA